MKYRGRLSEVYQDSEGTIRQVVQVGACDNLNRSVYDKDDRPMAFKDKVATVVVEKDKK